METPGSVDDHIISVARSCRLQRIEKHSRGVTTRFGADNFSARAISPHLELLDSGRAKSVRCTQQDSFSVGTQYLCQLSDGCGLASAIYADHQYNFGRALLFFNRRRICSIYDCEKFFL